MLSWLYKTAFSFGKEYLIYMEIRDVLTKLRAEQEDNTTYRYKGDIEDIEMTVKLSDFKPLLSLTVGCPFRYSEKSKKDICNRIEHLNSNDGNGILSLGDDYLKLKCSIWIDTKVTPHRFVELVNVLASDLYTDRECLFALERGIDNE